MTPEEQFNERVRLRRAKQMGVLRHFSIYAEIRALLDGHADRQAAGEWMAELALQWPFQERLAKYKPAYFYFEKRVNELVEILRMTCGDQEAVDRALAGKKGLLAALPEAAPDLALMLDREIRAARGDAAARAMLEAEPPVWAR